MPPQEILVCAKPSAARRVAGVLRSRGYAVETVADGTRALERAERENPAVVLIWSDLRGPETSTVVRRIREASGAKVAVIVKSDAIDRATTFLEAGAETVIPDARDLDRLARTVDRLLEGGLVVDPLPDLPAVDDFEPEEPVLNGKGGHHHDEAGPTPEGAPPEESPSEEGPGIAFEPCDVAEIVHEAAAEAAQGHPSVVVQVTAPPRLPTIGHAAALRGAVRALVQEACRDSEAASNVTVKAQKVDAGIFVLVSARGSRSDRPEAGEGEAPTGFTLARALVALHGGILFAEPIPAGGRRVSFTIPEQPPLLSGMELQGGFRALELLGRAEAAREAELEPSSEAEDDGPLLEQAIDLAAAAADAAALAPETAAEPERDSDPIRSLAELFGLEPDVEPVVVEAEPEVEDEAEEAALEASPDVEAEEPAEEVADEELGAEELEEEVPQVEVEELPEPPAEPEPDEPVEPAAEEPDEPVAAEPEEPEAAEPEVEAIPVIDLPDEVPEPASDLELEPAPEPVAIPEPVPAAEGSSAEPTPQASPQSTSYVADPLHPATAILRALAEEFDDQANGFRGF